ncbi:MAG: AAA family ATPase, partial [SAR324 cluster bacterium]|nr:AAA family ATPase [SAR324 cluster bacterium]
MSLPSLVEINTLAHSLTEDQSVEHVYGTELDWICDKFTQGLSVLVECDKQLTTYLYRALRGRLKQRFNNPFQLNLLSGQVQGDASGMALNQIQMMIQQLREAVLSGEINQILVLPHLDILSTSGGGVLSMDTRETVSLLYENPEAIFLAFKDPSFELPEVISNLFPAHKSLIGIARDMLPRLITQQEARKFGWTHFNPYALYKYFSGLNAIRCRQILGNLVNRMDYDEHYPERLHALYQNIREMTLPGNVELPHVDLEKEIGGYASVKRHIRSELLDLLHFKQQQTDPQAIQQLESLLPKGIIFYGPPGTGKTFFAKAIA